jgi:hypothetical protein
MNPTPEPPNPAASPTASSVYGISA